MDYFIRAVRLLSQACGIVAAALTAHAVVVVCQMVFIRYVLNQTTIWQTDFVTFSLVAATFIGAPYVLLTKGHVNVDVLPLYVGQRARWWPDVPTKTVLWGSVPYVLCMILALVILCIFPGIATWLPDYLMGPAVSGK